METYDPNDVGGTSTLIQENPEAKVPTGLLRPEKKVDESQHDDMADFSTPIDEVMPGPNMMMQDSMMAPAPTANKKAARGGNPFGLTDEQFQAALAGIAGVIAFSKPVQTRLGTMVPSMFSGIDLTTTGMALTAFIAAAIFFLAQRFLKDR